MQLDLSTHSFLSLSYLVLPEHKHGVIRTGNIQAMAELSKMKGDYAPEKHKIELDLPINITYKLKDRPAIEVEKK